MTLAAKDYDKQKTNEEDQLTEQLEIKKVLEESPDIDEEEQDEAKSYELPDVDIPQEELSVHVLPKKTDEFTCASCYLVHHKSQLGQMEDGKPICKECL